MKGFALIGALLAVVLIGALIAGAFVATTEEVRISGNVRMGARAMDAAESAIEADLAGWGPGMADSLGVTRRVAHSSVIDGLAVTTTLIRFDSSVYWIVADAGGGDIEPGGTPSVRRRIGVLLRRVSDSTGKGWLSRFEERPWSELF